MFNRKPKLPSVIRIGLMQFDIVETREPFCRPDGPKVLKFVGRDRTIMINPDIDAGEKARAVIEVAITQLEFDNVTLQAFSQWIFALFVDNPHFMRFAADAGAIASRKAKGQ